MYIHTNLGIESETSGIKRASKPTKPQRRHGRGQEGSSDLVAGICLLIFVLCICTLTLHVLLYRVCDKWYQACKE